MFAEALKLTREDRYRLLCYNIESFVVMLRRVNWVSARDGGSFLPCSTAYFGLLTACCSSHSHSPVCAWCCLTACHPVLVSGHIPYSLLVCICSCLFVSHRVSLLLLSSSNPHFLARRCFRSEEMLFPSHILSVAPLLS